jgi:aspartate kinase
VSYRIVHKFGGSCLRDSADLDRIAEVVQGDHQSIVIVSALWGTTDRLYRAAKEPRYASRLVHDLSAQHLRFAPGLDTSNNAHLFSLVLHSIKDSLRELAQQPDDKAALNRLLASGERLSALVVAHRLQQRGLDAYPLGAEDIGITLDGNYSATHVDLQASSTKLNRDTLKGTPVITGWFGEGHNGELAVLSRGGSDHSATAIAHLVEADEVILWKDVDGIFSINPRWGVRSKTIPYLGYQEAIELSLMDTPILHPSTIEPLIEFGIPLHVKHLHHKKNSKFTTIGPQKQNVSLKGIGCLPNVMSLGFSHNHVDSHQRHLVELLGKLAKEGINWWGLESRMGDSRLIVSQHDMHRAREVFTKSNISPDVHQHLGLISLIGCDEEMFKTIDQSLESANFELTWLSKTSHSARVALDGEELPLALELLNRIMSEQVVPTQTMIEQS